MKIKSMLAYTTLIVSVGFLGVVGIDNAQKDLNRISGKVLEGDISVLGESEYSYANYAGDNKLVLNINNEGITRNVDTKKAYYTNPYGSKQQVRFSDSYIESNKSFFENLNAYHSSDLYILKNELVAINKNIFEFKKEKLSLDVIWDNKGKIEEDILKIPYQDFKIKNIRGIADFSIITVGKTGNKLQMLLQVDGIKSDSKDDYKYNHQYTDLEKNNVYIEYDLETKAYTIDVLKDLNLEREAVIRENTLYVSTSGDIVLGYDVKDFKKKPKSYELHVYDGNTKYKWSDCGFSEISTAFYYICILQDGSIDLKYLDVETKEVSTYKGLKVFDVKELETQGENHIENPFTVTQVFIDGGKLFINYNYKSYDFDTASYMKVIDLESGVVELLLETTSSDYITNYDKLIK